MKSLMPWIIGFLVLLVIWACVEVGWLYSILTIGAVCCILYIVYSLAKKSASKDATEQDKKTARLSLKAVVVIAVGLIIVGVILGGIGLFNPGTDGYKSQVCGYCGGSGRVSSGAKCSLCNGAGGAVYENSVYADFTWLGILMAASGAVLFMGMAVIKDSTGKIVVTENKKTSSTATTPVVTNNSCSNDLYQDSIAQQYTVYMLIDEVKPNLEHPERLFEIKGSVVRGNIYGQKVVIVKSHITGETATFKVAGEGLKGKAGNRTRLNIYGTNGGKLNVTVGDSLYIV